MQQIEIAFAKGFDFHDYARPDIDAKVMKSIRLAINAGISRNSISMIMPFITGHDEAFNERQMEEILRGVEAEIDPSIYAKPEISAKTMEVIRRAIWEKQVNPEMIEPYMPLASKIDSQQMGLIVSGLRYGYDVSAYARPNMTFEKARTLYMGSRDGLDVTPYADPRYDEDQVEVLVDGARYKRDNPDIDESVYSNHEYSANLMVCLMLLQVHGYRSENIQEFKENVWDHHSVMNEDVIESMSPQQINQITKGYAHGIDPSIYTSLSSRGIGHMPMKKVVDALISGLNIRPYLPDARHLTEAHVDAAIARARGEN
jgi:hypothetical protein